MYGVVFESQIGRLATRYARRGVKLALPSLRTHCFIPVAGPESISSSYMYNVGIAIVYVRCAAVLVIPTALSDTYPENWTFNCLRGVLGADILTYYVPIRYKIGRSDVVRCFYTWPNK